MSSSLLFFKPKVENNDKASNLLVNNVILQYPFSLKSNFVWLALNCRIDSFLMYCMQSIAALRNTFRFPTVLAAISRYVRLLARKEMTSAACHWCSGENISALRATFFLTADCNLMHKTKDLGEKEDATGMVDVSWWTDRFTSEYFWKYVTPLSAATCATLLTTHINLSFLFFLKTHWCVGL